MISSLYLRIAGYASAAVVFIALGWHFGSAHSLAQLDDLQRADAAAALQAKIDADDQTQKLLKRATTAEDAYAKERADNEAFLTAHPLESVRLCDDSSNGGIVVPNAAATHTGNESTSTSGGTVQPLPAGDSVVRPQPGPDISGLLSFLAGQCDAVSAELREYQAR